MVGSHEIEQDENAFAEESGEWCQQTTQATSQRVSWRSVPENTGPAGACSEHFNFQSRQPSSHIRAAVVSWQLFVVFTGRDGSVSLNLNAAYAYSCDIYKWVREDVLKIRWRGFKMHAVIGGIRRRTRENRWKLAVFRSGSFFSLSDVIRGIHLFWLDLGFENQLISSVLSAVEMWGLI